MLHTLHLRVLASPSVLWANKKSQGPALTSPIYHTIHTGFREAAHPGNSELIPQELTPRGQQHILEELLYIPSPFSFPTGKALAMANPQLD